MMMPLDEMLNEDFSTTTIAEAFTTIFGLKDMNEVDVWRRKEDKALGFLTVRGSHLGFAALRAMMDMRVFLEQHECHPGARMHFLNGLWSNLQVAYYG